MLTAWRASDLGDDLSPLWRGWTVSHITVFEEAKQHHGQYSKRTTWVKPNPLTECFEDGF